jgi:hypothetical protein
MGRYESKTLSMMAVPRVAVSREDRSPSMPRVGTRYLTTVMPSPSSMPMSWSSPLRRFSRSMTAPLYSSGTRISSASHGSSILPVSGFSL